MKKLYSRVGIVLLALAVLVLTALLALGVMPFGVYVVTSGSMEPTMPLASVAIVEKNEPKLGEPITFSVHNETITHRWIATNADGTLQTKGDANDEPDLWNLQESQVIGGVVAVIPQLGYAVVFMQQPSTWLALVLTVVLIWLFTQLAKELREPEPFTA